MTVDTKTYVVGLLESYQKRSKQIDLLHYELSHPTDISENEMISALALSHGEGGGGTVGHISDKTLYIALNYQEQVQKASSAAKNEIATQLMELENIQKRLTYYVSLLDKRQAELLELLYFGMCREAWDRCAYCAPDQGRCLECPDGAVLLCRRSCGQKAVLTLASKFPPNVRKLSAVWYLKCPFILCYDYTVKKEVLSRCFPGGHLLLCAVFSAQGIKNKCAGAVAGLLNCPKSYRTIALRASSAP